MPPQQDEPPATQWVKLPPPTPPVAKREPEPAPTPALPPASSPQRLDKLKSTAEITPQSAFSITRESSGETNYYRKQSENSRLIIAIGVLGVSVIILVIALLVVTFFLL